MGCGTLRDQMTPVVFLPGLMCDRELWSDQIAALGDPVQPIVPEWDRRHDSLGAMAEAALVAAPPRFALAGHSMGGRVAFEVYRRAPDRVTHLAVLNTSAAALPDGPPGVEEEQGRRRLLAVARSHGVPAMAGEWLTGMLPADRLADTALTERIVGMFARKDADVFEAQTLALLARPDARPVLPTVRCPTLVLTGQDDQWSPPIRHQEMADAISGSTLVIVPRCGHMSTMERPEEVSRALRGWLGSVLSAD